jgi:hypothetical protein
MTIGTGTVLIPAGVEVRRTKYGNRLTTVFGIEFDSMREAQRYLVLRADLETGAISNLRLQVPFECVVNGKRVCKYIADFVYTRDGKQVVEDVKGMRTSVYRLKKKLVEALHAVEIVEV